MDVPEDFVVIYRILSNGVLSPTEIFVPWWHYIGLDLTTNWFSDMHKDIAFERFSRLQKANSLPEKAMRYCHSCEVGLGTMTYDEYFARHIICRRKCESCGKLTYWEPPTK